MSGFSVQILGVKALRRKFKNARREGTKRVRAAVRESAKNIRRRARRILSARRRSSELAGNFNRNIAKNIRYRMLGTRANVTAPFPAHIIEGGARPFMPPPRALEAWAAKKLGDPRLAFVAARSIAQHGLSPSPFLTTAAAIERRPHLSRMSRAVLGLELFRRG